MPSAEETTYLFKVMPETTQEFITRDVDLLVSQIKENLRLSGFKAKSSVSHKNRPSPYRVPSRSWAEPGNCDICGTRNNNAAHEHHHRLNHHHHHKRSSATRDDDPYELLQELLREGGLIKEAVKRLQTNLDEFEDHTEDEDDEEVDEDEEVESSEERQRRRKQQQQHRDSMGYRRKAYFYDSEDEPLPPSYEPLEL